ncbi:MAG TPA: 3-deoxy-7-phosphoheptulonate synthase [Spirochaetota bacterium]|nr:3-deoxy-7-phosphoheptulonate synthase [Spirochaetota bacterium]HNT12439.1 3-deoxy-7-phosphoheptulonate synthase [Spirochaetota bacterium]HNV49046.1 3-deoxy-7-phosphoheptulonate synthase [Spirochaetota bacterium]HPI23479.1 3-deoxy-7-phosphoheptulonate synthase [Spirochaetota bacterium]HPU87436.1 3-deoxy-7-phosphoheptulonate synthase [Spirochaetota bacterium]
MVLVLNEPESPHALKAKADCATRGCRAYDLATSRGTVSAVLGLGSVDLERMAGESTSLSVVTPKSPYILAGRAIKDTDTVVTIRERAQIGGGPLAVIAGPCSIESEAQIMETAERVRAAGAAILRGGAFKPRTSPYAFQGMGLEGLRLLRRAGDAVGLPIITEVLDADDIGPVAELADIIQIGARNCQNFSLLRKIGRVGRPVLLKRGMMVTIEEFLMSAEYLLSEGNMNVILCERGIRTFETETRNTLDISAVPILKAKTHLPVIVDPSHAAGTWTLIRPLALAAVAAGADGLMIEVHSSPETALCDGGQSLRPYRFDELMSALAPLAGAMGRAIAGSA